MSTNATIRSELRRASAIRLSRIALLLAISLPVLTVTTFAGFQSKKQVGSIRLDGWDLTARDGKLGLAKGCPTKWKASAPTITDEKGLFISGDPDGKAATVQLVKDKGSHANWAFEFTYKVEPEKAGRKEGLSNANLLVGTRGFGFKMKLSGDGPYKDWYVGVDPLSSEAKVDATKAPEWRPLKLVQDPKLAAEFEYVDGVYEVGHK